MLHFPVIFTETTWSVCNDFNMTEEILMYIEEIKERYVFLTLYLQKKEKKATPTLCTLDFLSTEMAQKEHLWGLSSASRDDL